MQLYRATDAALNNSQNSQEEPYRDLQEPFDTDQEENDPFAIGTPPNSKAEMLPPIGIIKKEISVMDMDDLDIESIFSGISGKRSLA